MKPKEVISELSALVESSSREGKLQNHIEQHPWIITGRHKPRPPIVISKPPLGADYFPDFAYFWRETGPTTVIQLVEIESPKLKVFKRNDEFTIAFSHAVQQLADWEGWCKQYRDGLTALMQPLLDAGHIEELPIFREVRTLLIAGRRTNTQANTRRRARWVGKAHEVGQRTIRSWEGFIDSISVDQFDWKAIKCLRYRGQGYEEIL